MKDTARIKVRTLEFLKIGRIPVINLENEEFIDHIDYPIVNGVMLVPLKDSHIFNISSSTLRKKIKAGKIKAYNEDGTRRAANARTDIYFDPYNFYQNDRNRK